jgi:hypothetical protein
MKRVKISMVVATAVCLALSGAVSGAQEKIPERQRDGGADAKMLTVSGCVARGASTGTYTLANKVKNEAAPTDADQPPNVALAGTEVDLAAHVGHIVSLTGSYAAATEPTSPTGTAGTDKPAAAADATKPLRTFTVKSLKMVASSCSEATQ